MMARAKITTEKGALKRKAAVSVDDGNKLEIKVSKINSRMLPDQRNRMVTPEGCYSNPGGPGC
jgi:hypothetical protein